MVLRNDQSGVCLRIPVLVFLILFAAPLADAQVRQAKQVLLLEDQTSAPAIDGVEEEFFPTLDAKLADPIDYYRESLDNILIPDNDYQKAVSDWYEHKYSKRRLDLIVSIGPESHELLRVTRDKFFPGVPIVFCLDQPDSRRPDLSTNSTGVWTDIDPLSTVDVARRLLPGTKRVAVVAGTGYFDQALVATVRKKIQGYPGVEFIYLTDLDFSSLRKKIASLPKDTVILYLTLTRDRSANHFFSRNAVKLVSETARVPVFGVIDILVGRGLVGGYTTSFRGQGYTAAGMAARILGGEKADNIPAVTATNQYVFDWKELHRWGLDPSNLPVGSTVIDRQTSIWEAYRREIMAVLAGLLLQTGLVLYLLIERGRRRRAQRALQKDIIERKKAEETLMDLSSQLITAQEEERSRIARELHDDFNQRLGMLAVDLERTTLLIPKNTDGAIQRMHELWDRTTLISDDLSHLSHALHSSVLDVLGLTEGIRGLCDDFSAEQGLQVEFASLGVPRSVPAGTSLCLFRIVQEGLRNVRKHSCADKASVELNSNGKEIILLIKDEGLGFDPHTLAKNQGLGLRSMQERLRSVGGTIEIQSHMGSGTRIFVRAPVS